jgi:membrane protease YdiL (CAAX protease family)
MENTLKEKIISKFFRWQPSSETLVAVIAGIVMIGLSISIGVTKNIPWLSTIIRDIG